MAPSDVSRKLVSLGTIGILLGVSAWLRPLQPPEWLPSHGINAVSVAIPGVRPVRLRDVASASAKATADKPEGRGQNGAPKSRAHAQPIAPRPHHVVEVLPASPPLAATDVPVVLTPEAPRGEVTVAVAAAPAGDPVADAFVTAGRHTGNAFQTGAAKTGGAFRTAGRAIRSIF